MRKIFYAIRDKKTDQYLHARYVNFQYTEYYLDPIPELHKFKPEVPDERDADWEIVMFECIITPA